MSEEQIEISEKVKDDSKSTDQGKKEHKILKPSFNELLSMLDEMNNSFDHLPPGGQFSYVTQCDLNAALLLIAELFRSRPS